MPKMGNSITLIESQTLLVLVCNFIQNSHVADWQGNIYDSAEIFNDHKVNSLT